MNEVLVLKSVNADMTAWSNFRYPRSGWVQCDEWDPTAVCGGGLHGFLWGQGDGDYATSAPDAKWLVLRVASGDIVNMIDKVKFRGGYVVFVGTRSEAAAYIREHGGPGMVNCRIIGADVKTGDNGVSVSGWRGRSVSGFNGLACAGPKGYADAGPSGVAVVGHGGTAYAGVFGVAIGGACSRVRVQGRSYPEYEHAYQECVLNSEFELSCSGGAALGGIAATAHAGRGSLAVVANEGTAVAGSRSLAVAARAGSARSGTGGVSIAGANGSASVGSGGLSFAGRAGASAAGDAGIAIAGCDGIASVGALGIGLVGRDGMVRAGEEGVIIGLYRSPGDARVRVAVGYIGEGGINANAYYQVNEHGVFEATEETGNA